MSDQEIYQQLEGLTTRQREVLELFCEGNSYKEIGEKLFITENSVKAHMGNIYIALGLTYIASSLRRKILFDTYCPVLHLSDFISQEGEPVEPEPISDEVIELVEKDERALVVVEPDIIDIPGYNGDEQPFRPNSPQPIDIQKDQKKDKGKKKRRFWRWILLIIVIALLVFGGMQVYSWARGFLNNVIVPMVAQETPEVIPTQGYVQPTLQPTSKPTKEVVVVPSNTSLPPTPQPTRTPSPKISLPFYEDFSNGINSPWSVGSGNWFVTDSGASISINDIYADAGSILIDDPTLTDYKLRVKVRTPHMWAASQGQFGVVVRYSSAKDQNIIFYMDSNGRFKWAYIESMSDLSFYQPPITGVDKDLGSTDVTLEIVVSGNSFTARVDGAKVDQFSMTGYENGGFALITACGSIGSCPSFSDLSIEPIN